MIIAIWTENKAKIKSLTDAIHKCVYFENPKKIEIIWKSVESWISDMPISLEENITWSKNRVNNLRITWIEADFYVWMEGGMTIIWDKSYLFWVVYISDWINWHLWFSPFLEVPKYFDDKIYNQWMDLWKIQNELVWDDSNNHKNGSFWEWTGDMITRSDSFEQAFLCAIAPFYNKYYTL